MEQNSYSLPYKHISNVAKETIQYINQNGINKIYTMALIQAFEICFELAWKTMKDYLENTCIAEAKNEKIDTCLVVNDVITDYNTLLKKVTEIKEEADNINEYKTSSLMDNYISLYMKHLWMLNQTNSK